MPQYTATQAGAFLGTSGAGPSNRVQVALLKYAATQYAGATGNVSTYIRRVASNPAGEANAVVPVLLAVINVANAAAEPTDAELNTGIGAIWTFLCGS